jgi:PIN domain nuclease of toxin-antitoxin system
VTVVADSHAILWFAQGSSRLSVRAAEALREAGSGDRIAVSVATLVDLWCVTQTTRGVTERERLEVRELMAVTAAVDLHPIDEAVADAYTAISRDVLTDSWDRFIVATAQPLSAPLVSRDHAIQESGLVETIW